VLATNLFNKAGVCTRGGSSMKTKLMVKAIWKEIVLAESYQTRVVERNHNFPPDSLNWESFSESSHTSVCFWTRVASYYDVEVDGNVNQDAAWT
jgi:uncharacterized protein (DUF427 family)